MRKEDSVQRHNDHALFLLGLSIFLSGNITTVPCRLVYIDFSIDTAWWMGVCCWVKAVGYAWWRMGMWVEWDGDGDGVG